MRNRSLLITLLLVLTLLVTACSAAGRQNNSPAGTGTAAVPNTGPGTGTTTPAATGAAGTGTPMATTAGTAGATATGAPIGTGTPSASSLATSTAGSPAIGQTTQTAPAGAPTATGQATSAGAAGMTTTPAATSAANANGTPSAAPTGVIGIPQTGTNGLVGLAAMLDFKVVDTQGSPIGTVQDYIVNTCESNLLYIVVTPASGGGNTNSSANQVLLIPYQATLVTPNQGKVDAANHTFVINVKAADLTSAPTVDLNTLDMQNPTWEANELSFWGSRARLSLNTGCSVPAPGSLTAPLQTATPAGTGTAMPGAATPGAATPGAATSGTATTSPGGLNIVTTTPLPGTTQAATPQGSLPVTGQATAAATAAMTASATGQTTLTPSFPTRTTNRVIVYRDALASKILGAALLDGNSVPLGTVKDAAVVPETGHLQYLLVQPQTATPSAPAQNGNSLVALPLGAVTIRYNGAGQAGASGPQPVFVLLVNLSIFQSAPVYNATNNTNDPAWFGYWQKYILMTRQQEP